MDAYIYNAEIFCEDCGEKIREDLTAAGKAPANPDDEHTYDSSEYPKGPISDGGGESDCVQHCGCGPDCINAIELDDGTKVGVLLENPLTSDGVEQLKESIRADPDNEVIKLWIEHYAKDYGIEIPEDEEIEPEEGDYTTDDHRAFYQNGKLAVLVPPGDDWEPHVLAHMKRENYWPNVWSISDHGNTVQLEIAERFQHDIETWKAEFYPQEASKVPIENAVAHSLQKWRGLTEENLTKHNLKHNSTSGFHIRRRGGAEPKVFTVDSGSCALCVYYYSDKTNCRACPLVKHLGARCDESGQPFNTYIKNGDPSPMIAALEAIQKEQQCQPNQKIGS